MRGLEPVQLGVRDYPYPRHEPPPAATKNAAPPARRPFSVSAHGSRGCSQSDLVGTGGNGLFYCLRGGLMDLARLAASPSWTLATSVTCPPDVPGRAAATSPTRKALWKCRS